jgi:uncharacterized membrane protein YfcA
VEVLDGLLVGGAGLLAGAVNAIAGGGTLVAFPALLVTGMPALTANITSSVGLVTGYVGGAVGYRSELAGQAGRVRALAVPAFAGGFVGAVVLLATPGGSFRAAVPYLVLFACLLLALQPWLAAMVSARREAAATILPGAAPAGSSDAAVIAATGPRVAAVTWPTRVGVFLAGVYGSYFGAGLGVLLLGVLGILAADDTQRMNALKSLLSFGVNAIGVTVFLVSARVSWAFAGILVVTSAAGGLLGASLARRLDATVLRGIVILIGSVVSLLLFVTG